MFLTYTQKKNMLAKTYEMSDKKWKVYKCIKRSEYRTFDRPKDQKLVFVSLEN